MELSKKRNQFLAAVGACIGAFSIGTSLGWSNPVNAQLRNTTFEDSVDLVGYDSTEKISWISSMFPIGAFVAGPFGGYIVMTYGRKISMLLFSAPLVLGWLLITYGQNLAMLLIGRFITGFVGGSLCIACPVYIGETAEPSVRGILSSGFQLMITLGILFTYVIYDPSWRILSLVCALIPLVLLLVMIFMPESPRFLIEKKRDAEAIQALVWLRKANSAKEVEDEIEEIKQSVNEANASRVAIKDAIKSPGAYKPTLMALALMLFQQLSGINAVIFFSENIFKSASSEGGLTSAENTIIIGVVQVVATLVSTIIVDKVGRRILLMISGTGMGISLVLLGIYFAASEITDKEEGIRNWDNMNWLPLVSLMLFIIAFSVGYGPIPWMSIGEMLPLSFKGPASAIATSFNWFLASLVTKLFEPLSEEIDPQYLYWFFAIVCGIGVAFVLFILPETKGKTLDEIQRYFGEATLPPQNRDLETPAESQQNKNEHSTYGAVE